LCSNVPRVISVAPFAQILIHNSPDDEAFGAEERGAIRHLGRVELKDRAVFKAPLTLHHGCRGGY
jgi:hypothetical protein